MADKYYITNGSHVIGLDIINGEPIYKKINGNISKAAKFRYMEAQSFISSKLNNDINWSIQKIYSNVNRKNYIITNASDFAANDCTVTNDFNKAKCFSSIEAADNYIQCHKEIVRCFKEPCIIDENFEPVKKVTEKQYEIIGKWQTPVIKRNVIKKSVRASIYEHCGRICSICGKPLNYNEMTIDHIIPISRGGGNTQDNLRCVCPECNRIKGNRLDSEMYKGIVNIFSWKVFDEPDNDSWNAFIRAKVRGDIKKYVGG